MATEPTLGNRIVEAATWWSACVRDDDQGNDAGDVLYEKLRTLAARADAAERGMVAFAEEVAGDNWHRIVAERTEALAAWRAITGEVQP